MVSNFQFTSLIQPLFALLNSTVETTDILNTSFTNATQNVTASTLPLLAQSDFFSLFTFISSFSALRDYLKLIILGGAFETFRRLYSISYTRVADRFFITATFDSEDFAFRESSFSHSLSSN
jgi:mitochondrial chaperone BCS1